jgi:uncharacterized ferritin-like protein (DUF455 family)
MMELSRFATRILFADTLEGKLYQPPRGLSELTDKDPGEARAWSAPGRPPSLEISPRRKRVKFPHPDNFGDAEMGIRALHTFANHELMAVELMAWALLAYPDAPPSFRAGLARLIVDEQRHLSLYMNRIDELGATFGELAVNDHFWRCAPDLDSPLKWVCAMNLTFEQGNLDHAPYFQRCFEKGGDEESARIMGIIYEDEIHHVAFGAQWLEHFRPENQNSFETYLENLTFHNEPGRGRGEKFDVEARRRAGLDSDFIEAMKSTA